MNPETLPTKFADMLPTLITVREQVAALTIRDNADYLSAGDLLRRIKVARNQIESKRTAISGPLNEALKVVNAEARESDAPFAAAEKAVKEATGRYEEEQKRLQIEAQRKADELARAEREKLARQAREAEAKARADQEALRAAAAKAEAEGRAAEAAKLAAKADRVEERAADRVESLQMREAMVVAPLINRTPPKIEGQSSREVWKFEITDPAKVPAEYRVIDESLIRKVVSAMKGASNIPGVRVYSERQTSVRT